MTAVYAVSHESPCGQMSLLVFVPSVGLDLNLSAWFKFIIASFAILISIVVIKRCQGEKRLETLIKNVVIVVDEIQFVQMLTEIDWQYLVKIVIKGL